MKDPRSINFHRLPLHLHCSLQLWIAYPMTTGMPILEISNAFAIGDGLALCTS
ncbi:hypothetical protein BDQ12DRAFT_689669 [Crucibulum laeve]|uniref:Uncharacterized protein n=1 Tax=Crucibulum laeve TaxID=68775 RepID=A0A5C3LQ87_9AGAR|nr:hypothetical protein BDQ12DRAFT_689669 [Crucibulum laeve]